MGLLQRRPGANSQPAARARTLLTPLQVRALGALLIAAQLPHAAHLPIWVAAAGIVLVGEYMGWNFAVGKGGAVAALIACWFAGLLYTCVAMIDSEVTSTVAAAGGQYTQA